MALFIFQENKQEIFFKVLTIEKCNKFLKMCFRTI